MISDIHPAWLPAEAFRALGSRRVQVRGDGLLLDTVRAEVVAACRRFGGAPADSGPCDVSFAVSSQADLAPEEFTYARGDGVTVVRAADPAGLLHGFFHVVRSGERAFAGDFDERHAPALPIRLVSHWDNVDVHPVMGQVERGYAGGSIFWSAGRLREDLSRVRAYARLLAAGGINAVAINNVNVHETEAHLLTDRIGEVAALAEQFRAYGIRVHLSVNFAAPMALGGLPTADPLDDRVRAWWAQATQAVYARIPDFGGYVVKADSEGQPGPSAYARTHADGANLLAEALAPFGGVVHWRAFVYNHRQDWRDRSTDRARAAYDHFAPLDGRFAANVILQVKHGPMDFQVREPVSPLLGAMPSTRVAVEVQATQEYTGQQRHVCYLGPMWSEVLRFPFARPVAELVQGMVTVANVGDDPFWTGHPLAQANLYAAARLGWDPALDPLALLDEWIALTFPGHDPALREALRAIMDESWQAYERYTAPLGVGFMVRPGHHYGPDVDGYEYTPWGTYHFADRDGIGVDRTRATGTGFTGQYPAPWRDVFESRTDCPDELLLFFHHVPYAHLLRNGATVVQHIYDTHFAGVDRVEAMILRWQQVAGLVDEAVAARISERLAEQLRSAEEWRDQVNTYFYRKSGVPDARGRRIY
ncbi:MAG: alpha-glucuronidase [Hamadaea sp.]|nr:alpha-glucuronidase [Hamadaea sp.]